MFGTDLPMANAGLIIPVTTNPGPDHAFRFRSYKMPVVIFDGRDAAHDEDDYLDWLRAHPEGYLLNTGRNLTPGYMSLHRPHCTQISRYKANDQPGAFTEHELGKVCADTWQELDDWLRNRYGPAATFSSEGCYCVQ